MIETIKIPQPEIEAYHAGYQAGYENGKRDAENQAHWIYNEGNDIFVCSHCGGSMVRNIFTFCPWCGFEMNEEVSDNAEIH